MLFGTFAEFESKDFSKSFDESERAESDLEEEEDFTNPKETPKRTGAVLKVTISTLSVFSPPATNPPMANTQNASERKGHKDTSYDLHRVNLLKPPLQPS